MNKQNLTEALRRLEPKTKAAKIRELMPVIEEKMALGVRTADIRKVLKDNGVELSEATLKSYLYRYRKKREKTAPTREEREPTSTDAVGVKELDGLMKPNPAEQAQDLAHYEHLAAKQRRRKR